MNEEQLKLVLDNDKLVHYTLRRMKIEVNSSYDDVLQEARIGLIKAATTFDKSLGYTFSTYAMPYISGCVKRHYRDFVNRKVSIPRTTYDIARMFMATNDYSEVYNSYGVDKERVDSCVDAYNAATSMNSLQGKITTDDSCNNTTLGDILVSDDNVYDRLLDNDEIRDAFTVLDDIQSKVVYMSLIEGYDQRHVSKVIGISQVQVSRALKRAKLLLQDALTQGDNLITYNSKTLPVSKWACATGISYISLVNRINKGLALDDVFCNGKDNGDVC